MGLRPTGALCYPWACGLELYKKASRAIHGESHTPVVSAPDPASSVCPDFFAWYLKVYDEMSPFFPELLLVMAFITATEKQTRACCKGSDMYLKYRDARL